MLDLIQRHGDFPRGSRQPRLIAQDWIDEGFTPPEAEAYLRAGVVSPPLARVFADRGITAELVGLPELD